MDERKDRLETIDQFLSEVRSHLVAVSDEFPSDGINAVRAAAMWLFDPKNAEQSTKTTLRRMRRSMSIYKLGSKWIRSLFV